MQDRGYCDEAQVEGQRSAGSVGVSDGNLLKQHGDECRVQ
jgi:hypothetical protein